jgi:AcrR family transcriptional regulator
MSSPTRRTGGRSARVEQAVLRATLEAFADGGWSAMRIDDIALRAGVHKTTIYRRWSSRQALLTAALDATPFRTPGATTPNTGSLRGDLQAMADETHEALREPRTRAIIRRLAESAGEPELSAATLAFWSSRIELAGAVVGAAVGRGELPHTADVELLATMFVGAIKLWAVDLGSTTRRAWLEQLVAATIRAGGGTP